MGLDFIPYVYLVLSFIFALVCVINPNYFLGIYLFLYTFLMMRGEKVDLGFIQLGTYRIFLVVILVGFVLRFGKNVLKSFQGFSWSQKILLGGLFFSIITLPTFHYFCWGTIPYSLTMNSIKALFPLIFFLFPSDQWNIKLINRSLILSSLAVLIVTTVPSVQYFLTFREMGDLHISGYYRVRTFNWEALAYSKYYYLNNSIIPVLNLSDIGALIWSVFAVPLLFAVLRLFGEKKKRAIAILVMIYIAVMLNINQMLKMVVAEVITIVAYLWEIILDKSRSLIKIAGVILFIFLIIITTHRYASQNYKDKFTTGKVDLTKTINAHPLRYELMSYSVIKLWQKSPFIGFGYPENHGEGAKLPFGNSPGEYTGHMEGVDMLFYFGLFFGWLASYLYIAPLIFILLNLKKWIKKDTSQPIQLFLISSLAVMLRFVGELGRDVEVNSMFVYFLILVIMYDRQNQTT